MTPQSVVIVGAGQGGLQAAISLRQNGFSGSITLIGAEPGLPYQRPPLSKVYLMDGNAEPLVLRPESFFVSKDITYLPDTFVEAIDRKACEISIAGPNGKRKIPYDHLILATGTRNLLPPLNGVELSCNLRTLSDAKFMRERLAQTQRSVVIGGGFIGLEFAAVMRKLGQSVSVIEAAPRLMSRAVSPLMSKHFEDFHRSLGTELYLGQPAASIDEAGVTLADGTKISGSFVLLAAGVRPNTELAEESGLEINNGIQVDANLLTSDPAISALGDCASFPDPRSGKHIRLESVQAATDHARLIAARIVKGEAQHYNAVPWFWSDQANQKLQIAGYAGPDAREEAVAEGVVARFGANGLEAVETVNNARVHMKTRKILANGNPNNLAALQEVIAA